MDDRELLELAAKASGVGELVYHSDEERYAVVWMPAGASRNEWAYWNPLTDDGDALRLAVKLSIIAWRNVVCPEGGMVAAPEGACPYEAARRAIVRAAAGIGRSMP